MIPPFRDVDLKNFAFMINCRLAHRGAAVGSVGAMEIADRSRKMVDHVLIAGYGRVGRTVARELHGKGIPYIALDNDPYTVTNARSRGEPVYFGDAGRTEIFEALHLTSARAVVVAINDSQAATRLVGTLRHALPNRPILARAANESHADELMEAGATFVVPELVATGQRLAERLLNS